MPPKCSPLIAISALALTAGITASPAHAAGTLILSSASATSAKSPVEALSTGRPHAFDVVNEVGSTHQHNNNDSGSEHHHNNNDSGGGGGLPLVVQRGAPFSIQ